MAEVVYDFAALDQSITNSASVRDYMEGICGNITSFMGSCDKRVLTYYEGEFTGALRGCKSTFNNHYDNMNDFGSWLSQQYQDCRDTDEHTQDIAGGAGSGQAPVNGGIGNSSTGKSDTSPLDLSCVVGTLEDQLTGSGDAALQLTFINPESFQNLPSDIQDAVKAALKKVGYTDEEITSILNGQTGVKSCVVNAVSSALESTLAEHPELRDTIVDLYGFDPFDEDGKVNPDLVTAILLVDSKDPNDKYDIIKLLHDKYGVDLVDPVQLASLTSQLETALSGNPNLRALILQKYGIDIFNDDGTINKSRLAILMLMDNVDAKDDYNLKSLLASLGINSGAVKQYTPSTIRNSLADNISSTVSNKNTELTQVGAGLSKSSGVSSGIGTTMINGTNPVKNEEEKIHNLTHNVESVKPVLNPEETKKQNTAAIAIGLGGLGALGVTGGGIAATKKKSEEEEDEEKKKEQEDEVELFRSGDGVASDEEEEGKKEWLYGLGIGLAAAAATGKALSKDDEDKDETEEEFKSIS